LDETTRFQKSASHTDVNDVHKSDEKTHRQMVAALLMILVLCQVNGLTEGGLLQVTTYLILFSRALFQIAPSFW